MKKPKFKGFVMSIGGIKCEVEEEPYRIDEKTGMGRYRSRVYKPKPKRK